MTKSKILIYSTKICPFCIRAKTLLNNKNAKFEEIDISASPDLLNEMLQKSGGRKTVPQIFIGDQHIGGFDDLQALDNAGKLDAML